MSSFYSVHPGIYHRLITDSYDPLIGYVNTATGTTVAEVIRRICMDSAFVSIYIFYVFITS